MVTEAKRCRDALKGLAERHGYHRIHPTAQRGEEAPDIAVLVRGTLDLTRDGFLTMTEPWWWGRDPDRLRKREPRVYPVFTVAGWPMLAVHFPPAPLGGTRVGRRNVPAGRESIAAVVNDCRGLERCLIVGDFNLSRAEVREHIADPLGARVTSFGDGASHAVIVGGRMSQLVDLPEKPGQHGRAVTTIEKE